MPLIAHGMAINPKSRSFYLLAKRRPSTDLFFAAATTMYASTCERFVQLSEYVSYCVGLSVGHVHEGKGLYAFFSSYMSLLLNLSTDYGDTSILHACIMQEKQYCWFVLFVLLSTPARTESYIVILRMAKPRPIPSMSYVLCSIRNWSPVKSCTRRMICSRTHQTMAISPGIFKTIL